MTVLITMTYNAILTVISDTNGTTDPSGDVTVNHDVSTSISAVPDTGYSFLNWTVDTGSADITDLNSLETTVTLSSGNATIKAGFIKKSDTLCRELD